MNEQKCVQNKYCSLTIVYFFFSNQLRNLTGVTTGLATLTYAEVPSYSLYDGW